MAEGDGMSNNIDIRPAVENLAAVLRAPDGDICIPGSPADKAIVSAALDALAQAAPTLWCLHILGPDDVHPAPSQAHAELAAANFNERFSELSASAEVMCKAVAAPWPHDPTSHAESVHRFIQDWMVCLPAMPEPEGFLVSMLNDATGRWGTWRQASRAEFDAVAKLSNWRTKALYPIEALAAAGALAAAANAANAAT